MVYSYKRGMNYDVVVCSENDFRTRTREMIG
jgi:hypothetical protein